METYLDLKTNFFSLGDYEDASWAYVKEQQMEKMAHWEKRDYSRWARNWLYELLTGYGERPHMPAFWGLVTTAIFTLVFFLAGNIASESGAAPSRDFGNALTQSIAAFATVGFSDLHPVGWGARLLTAVESMLGIGLFALFIYTLGNRMSRS